MTDLPSPSLPSDPLNNRPRPRKWRVIAALMLREMSTRYGRNPGGYFWAILEPLGIILVLSIGFSLLVRTPSLGSSFLLFYASGILPFQLFIKTSNFVQNALRYSKSLLNYPVVSWFDAITARAVTNGITICMVSAILLVGIMLSLPSFPVVDPGPIFGAFLAAFVMGLGVGLMNSVLVGFFPVWGSLWSIATAPIFIMSGVIWIYEDLPQLGKELLYWNPLVHVLALSRSGIYKTYDPEFVNLTFVWAVALVLLAMGLLLMRRFYAQILQN